MDQMNFHVSIQIRLISRRKRRGQESEISLFVSQIRSHLFLDITDLSTESIATDDSLHLERAHYRLWVDSSGLAGLARALVLSKTLVILGSVERHEMPELPIR